MHQEQEASSQSPHLQEYNSYFASSHQQVNEKKIIEDIEAKGISISNSVSNEIQVEISQVVCRGAKVSFVVSIGQFRVPVLMLNHFGVGRMTGKKVIYGNDNLEILDVYSVQGGCYVSKRVYFREATKALRFHEDHINWNVPGDYRQVEATVIECAFGKLCAAMKVGIGFGSPDHCFDLVCYDNYIEFFMDKGLPPLMCKEFEIEHNQERLKYCLAVMHHFGLVHKDIKPENFLINQSGEAVLADFGISTFTTSKPGSYSFTYRQGTLKWMSPAMLTLGLHGCGQIDLFYNDLYGLRLSIQWLVSQTRSCESLLAVSLQRKGIQIQQLEEAIYELSRALKRNPGKSDVSDETLKLFSGYFPQLGSTIVQQDFKVELLVRVFGLSPRLIFYLQQIPKPSNETKLLIAKLLRKIEVIPMVIENPHLPQKHAALRKAYRQALCQSREGDDPTFSNPLVCRFGISLAEDRLKENLYEQALEILGQIEPFLTQEYDNSFNSLRIRAEVFKQSIDSELIESLLIKTSGQGHRLVQAAMTCFMRANYVLSFRILSFISRKQIPQQGIEITWEVILDKLQVMLNTMQETEGIREVIWEFYGICAISMMQPHRILKAKFSSTSSLTAAFRLKIVLATARALLETSQLSHCMQKLKEAVELSKGIYSQCGTNSAYINLEIADLQAELIADQKPAERLVTTYLRYVETTVGDDVRIVAFALKTLSFIHFRNGNFENCLDCLVKGLKIVKRSPINDSQSIVVLSDLAFRLAELCHLNLNLNGLSEVALLIQECLSKPASKTLQSRVYLFQVHLTLSMILSKFGSLVKSAQQQRSAFGSLDIVNQPSQLLQYGKVLFHLCRLHKMYLNHSKAFEYALKMVDIVLQHRDHCRLIDMLKLCLAVRYLRQDRSEAIQGKSREVLQLTVSLLQEEADPHYTEMQYYLALHLYDISLYEISYKIAKPLFKNCAQSIALAARCLFYQGQYKESEPLFLEHLRRQKVQPLDFEQQKMIVLSHNHLRHIYRERGNKAAREYHLQRMIESFNQIDLQNRLPKADIIAEMLNTSITERCRSMELKCKKMLFDMANNLSANMGNRMLCFKLLGESVCITRSYRLAFKCFTKAIKISEHKQPSQILFGMAFCCVALRKWKTFFAAAIQLQEKNSSLYSRLIDLLLSRRQFIPVYLLEQACPQGCNTLKFIVEELKDEPFNIPSSRPCKTKLLELVFTKRLIAQTLQKGQEGVEIQRLKAITKK